jgi:hypothetical protein
MAANGYETGPERDRDRMEPKFRPEPQGSSLRLLESTSIRSFQLGGERLQSILYQ